MFSPIGSIISQQAVREQFRFKTAILEDTPQMTMIGNLITEELIEEDPVCMRLRSQLLK